MAEFRENAPVHSHEKRMIKLQNHCVILFVLRKGKTKILVTSSELFFSFFSFFNLLITKDRITTLFTLIVDHGWREGRFPSLTRVLLWLVRVAVPQVSVGAKGSHKE